jgi:hypothetical protein
MAKNSKNPKEKQTPSRKTASAKAATKVVTKQPGRKRKPQPTNGPLAINTHKDLLRNMRAISNRLNDSPELARMLLVNPILALEDAGVELTPEVKEHIMDSLRFPPSLVKRREELELELHDELSALGVPYRLPLSGKQRADLMFRVLKLASHETDALETTEIGSKRIRAYSRQHPLVAKLAEYERLRQGRLIFFPRKTYEAYKAGLKRQNWIKAVKFKV